MILTFELDWLSSVLWMITRNFYSRNNLIAGDQPESHHAPQTTEGCLRGLVTERNLATIVKMWLTTLVPCPSPVLPLWYSSWSPPFQGYLEYNRQLFVIILVLSTALLHLLLFWKHFQSTEEFFQLFEHISEYIPVLKERTDGCIKYSVCKNFFFNFYSLLLILLLSSEMSLYISNFLFYIRKCDWIIRWKHTALGLFEEVCVTSKTESLRQKCFACLVLGEHVQENHKTTLKRPRSPRNWSC